MTKAQARMIFLELYRKNKLENIFRKRIGKKAAKELADAVLELLK